MASCTQVSTREVTPPQVRLERGNMRRRDEPFITSQADLHRNSIVFNPKKSRFELDDARVSYTIGRFNKSGLSVLKGTFGLITPNELKALETDHPLKLEVVRNLLNYDKLTEEDRSRFQSLFYFYAATGF